MPPFSNSGVLPRKMGELRVDRHTDHFDIALLEFIQTVIECDQLGRTHKGEVQRIEKHTAYLPLMCFFRLNDSLISCCHHGDSIEIGADLPTSTAMFFS